jgi:hypothetical protein
MWRRRPPAPGEVELLRRLFGDGISYDQALIAGPGGNPIAWAALEVGGAQAIALGNSIHFHAARSEADFSLSTTGGQGLLAHEYTHIWQYRTGRATPVGIALNSLAMQRRGLDPYDISGVTADTAFADLGFEQQATLIGAIAQALHAGRRPEAIAHVAVIKGAGLLTTV